MEFRILAILFLSEHSCSGRRPLPQETNWLARSSASAFFDFCSRLRQHSVKRSNYQRNALKIPYVMDARKVRETLRNAVEQSRRRRGARELDVEAMACAV